MIEQTIDKVYLSKDNIVEASHSNVMNTTEEKNNFSILGSSLLEDLDMKSCSHS